MSTPGTQPYPADLIVEFECPMCHKHHRDLINLCNNEFLPLVRFFSDNLVCPDCGVNASGIHKLIISNGKDSFTVAATFKLDRNHK